MARKRPSPLLDPPPVSSSEENDEEEISEEEADDHIEGDPKTKLKPVSREEEEEEDEDDDEEDDEEEEEEEETPPKQPPSVQKPTTQQTQSASESDPDEESEIESPTASAFTIKPIVSNPSNDLTKSAPPNLTTPTSTPLSKGSSKRPTETEQNGNESAKKRKVSNKSGINRLWSEEDEIAILEGVIDFQLKVKIDPFANMDKFHEFVKKLFKVDVSKSQLMSKIKRLKKKYRINAVKGENGENPVFAKPHDHKSFELSKKIWGGGASSSVDNNGKSEKRSSKKKGKVDNPMNPKNEKGEEFAVVEASEGLKSEVKTNQEAFWSLYSGLKNGFSLSMSASMENFMTENMSLIGNAKAKELEEKWNKLQVSEIEVYLNRVKLIKEQTELVLAAMKSSNSK